MREANYKKEAKFWQSKPFSPVYSAKFVAKKNLIVVDADLIFIRGYNCSTWSRITTIEAHSERITCISVHRENPYLISASDDASIKIWSHNDWTLIRTLHGHSSPITHISLSPSGNTFASGCQNGSSKVCFLHMIHGRLPPFIWIVNVFCKTADLEFRLYV